MHFASAAYAADAYLEITLKVDDADRANAAAVYTKYKQPFLDTIPGATSKELLIRTDDVQVLHGFSSEAEAQQYLTSELFTKDVVGGLSPYLKADPEIRIYKSM
ncbi:MAG: hypothetical protein K8I04_03000 [Gammaproteobacteria bacterium]|nr:hypothetical protein [Gammaproteobacteria bacterium]